MDVFAVIDTLVCPRCRHMSRKFDPFMYLSLPLPTTKTRTFSVVGAYAQARLARGPSALRHATEEEQDERGHA